MTRVIGFAAGLNPWGGVGHDRYSVAEQVPIFLGVFAVPVVIARGIARAGR